MFSLLLVDDEPSILNGLYQNVDWYELGIDSVYKAAFAADALSIIGRHHIDLVITDIRMPEMDGVTLAGLIRKSWPFTKIIFLTGHQDFTYAQTAVDLGVFRYLLKPVLYEDLREVVREALEVLSQALANEAHVKNIEEKIHSLRPALRERYLSRWLEWGDTELLEHSEEIQECEIPLSRTDWGFILAVKPDTLVDRIQEATILHLSIRDLAARILYTEGRVLDYSNMKNHSILIFLQESAEAANLLQTRVSERLEAFQFTLSEARDQTFTLFWTEPVPAPQLHEAYSDLKGRMDRHITLVRNSMVGPEKRDGPHAAAELKSLLLQPSLTEIISSLRIREAQERLKAIFTELAGRGGSESLLLQVYHEITGILVTDSLHRGFVLQQWAGEYMDYFESMASVRTLEQFCETSMAVVESYLDYTVNNSLSQAGNLITMIQSIVREDLTKDVTVASLAEQFSYHPNYLSRLFKQEMKISLQEFIINERIAAAKNLLSHGMKVGDVPEKVGYDSIAHFSRIFKKVTGLNPKQYQQSSLEL